MMDKFDKILQIFELQKEEISKMSNKINNLEKTNLFLMKFIEQKNDLSAVCDISEIQRYKELAVDREQTINNGREKTNMDTTICETSLSYSFECPNKSDFRKSNQSCYLTEDDISLIKYKPESKVSSTNVLNHDLYGISNQISIGRLSQQNSLEIRQSSLSPIHRIFFSNIDVLCNNEQRNGPSSVDQSQSSDEKKNTIIIKNIEDNIKTSKDLSLSYNSDKCHMIPLSSLSHNTSELISSSINPLNSEDDNKLKDAIDHLITTLEQRKSSIYDSSESFFSDQLKQVTRLPSIQQLLSTKDSILSELDDKHIQMKLLLSSQQVKADLFHKSLKSNNDRIISFGHQIIQNNSSNKIIRTNKEVKKINNSDVRRENEDTQGITSHLLPSFVDFRSRRQTELDRLNNSIRDQLLIDPRMKNGFEKFTALIKGYIVRTLLETDKVRSIIMTIKDTAQMALRLRQERLSGDCAQHGDNSNTRKNNQEVISFQNRLLSQLKSALNELHEIFFEWPSHYRVNLLRSHINQIISSVTKCSTFNENTDQGTSTLNINKVKKMVPLSSATLKRRQNLALKSASSSTKENGSIKSSSWSSQRKSIYSNLYGCRGHASGSFPRTANGQSRNGFDRKSRPINASHRRNVVRKEPVVSMNTVSSSSMPNSSITTRDDIKSDEYSHINTMSNLTHKIAKKDDEQQQQRWIPQRTVTTSICSQAAGDGHPYKGGFITGMLDKTHCVYDTITVHQDSEGREAASNEPSKSISLPDTKEAQANTNNFEGGSANERSGGKNGTIFHNNLQSLRKLDNAFYNVDIDIGENVCAPLYEINGKPEVDRGCDYSEYSTDISNVVLVDISQRSSESDSISNNLRSTFNSDTNHCPNKPTVTINNTKYIPGRVKSSVVAVPLFSKNIPIPIQNPRDFDFSSSNINVLPYRTFKIKKRIIACSNKHS